MKNFDIIVRVFKTQVSKFLFDFLSIFILMILTGISTAAVAWLLDPAIKKIFIEKDQTMLVLIPIAIVIAFCVKALSVYFTRTKSILVCYKIVKNVKILLAEKILKSDTSYLTNIHSGKFISNFTNDTGIIGNVLNNAIINAIKEFITLIFLLGLMLSKDLTLSLLAFTLIPVAAFFSRKLGKKMGKAVTQALNITDLFTKNLSEILKATLIIKIYQQEKRELDNFSKIITDRIDKIMKMEKTRLGAGPIMETITGVAIALVVFAGGYRSISGAMEVGAFFSFLTALMLAYQPIRALAGINIALNEGLSALKRIYAILDNKDQINEIKNSSELVFKEGNISFNDVDMEYVENLPVLKKISFEIKGGQKIAFVGKSGSGKTTLINLIPRFYNTTKGEIKIDNQNINKVNLVSLRKKISMVGQDTILFDDTIMSNIQYGKIDATEDEIIEASKLANCHEFIMKLERGYETVVGENGVKLSGGQKQRISIARAIIKDSQIILMDEATSALDTESELMVQNAINNLTKKKTTIFIAHRLSTIKNVDQIYVLDAGRIIEHGTHDELIKKNSTYKYLVEQQSF